LRTVVVVDQPELLLHHLSKSRLRALADVCAAHDMAITDMPATSAARFIA
jgi:hypothetical protein